MSYCHVMEHYAIANSRENRVRLAELIKKDIVKFTMDLRPCPTPAATTGPTRRQLIPSQPCRGRTGPDSTPTKKVVGSSTPTSSNPLPPSPSVPP